MSRRRTFDIAVPDEMPVEPAPLPRRRGPMATAIGEASGALRERARIEDELRAENDALAHELVRLRGLGLVAQEISLGAIRTDKLVRDRSARETLDVEDLVASIAEVGLSNPIRVEERGDGDYELIQGLRRLTAYRTLHERTEQGRWSAIPAAVFPRGKTLATLYRRMVDENMVRADLSFAEMASLAQAYARDGVDGCRDVSEAVNTLYASAAPQKRSYIRRFAMLLGAIGPALRRPEAIPRALGLSVADRLEAEPKTHAALAADLTAADGGEAELEILRAFAERAVATPVARSRRGAPTRRQNFDMDTRLGPVRVSWTGSRLDLRLPDRSGIDEIALRRAVARLVDDLDG